MTITILLTFCDFTLTLSFLSMTLVLIQYLWYTYKDVLGELKLFEARLTDTRVQTENGVFFYI